MEEARLTGEFADWHNLNYMAMWLTGDLNIAVLRDAWERICRRHDVLRRTYVSAEEACTYDDVLSEVELFTAETDAEAIELMRQFLGTPFSLDGPGFSRIAVVQRSERRYLFGLAMDHIINDVVSWNQICADFIDFYDRALVGATGDVANENSYQNFASAQRRLFSGTWGKERRDFWGSYVEEFETYPPLFSVGVKHTGEYQRHVISRELPPDAKSRVQSFSRQSRVTPFAVVTSSVLTAMREVTGDPLVGISVNQHGRMLPGTAQTAGLFVQSVPLHLGQQTMRPFETVQDVFLRTHDVFEYALPLLVAGRSWNESLMVPDKEPGLHVRLNEYPPSSDYLPPFTGTEAEYVELHFPGEKRWLETVVVTWNLFETGPQLVAHYNRNYFPDRAVEQLLDAAERFALQADG
ncbi:condensation domain-containing protein [Streptomyces sp. NPDC094468]|uniref:condensation domain-containing protein n=1 Tax=Streptomyces sp. NPDC094468 TaxID=3366066 RepID=UPI0038023FB5